jgi:histidinol-phosphate/aromatic aminotransferase/cobyric acid decarboxylase-like protein
MLEALVEKQMKRNKCVDFSLIASLMGKKVQSCTTKAGLMKLVFVCKPKAPVAKPITQEQVKPKLDILASKGVRYDLGMHMV